LLSAGFSGALNPEMSIGDVVVANEITGPAGEQLSVDIRMEPDPKQGLYVGRIATVDHIVRSAAEKRSLAEQCGAIAVDMESLAVAHVAQDARLRFMAIRAI